MRHVFVVLDASKAMEDHDLRPDRLSCSKKVTDRYAHAVLDQMLCNLQLLVLTNYSFIQVLEKFLVEFFDQNPISQVCIRMHVYNNCYIIPRPIPNF